jgi:hypothetical protein
LATLFVGFILALYQLLALRLCARQRQLEMMGMHSYRRCAAVVDHLWMLAHEQISHHAG